MDPIALAAYIADEWAEIVAEVGMDASTVTDRVEAIYTAQPSLDDAWAEPLADYYVLRRAVRAFAVDFDVTIDGDSYRLSQRKQIADLYATAYARVAWIVAAEDDDTGTVVTVRSDFLTGETTEGASGW